MRRVLFSTIALFALLFASCEELPFGDTNSTGGDNIRVVSDTLIKMPANGGNAEIMYVINTAVEGATVTASSTTAWITNIEAGDTVTFTVLPNNDSNNRNGSICIEYANTKVTVDIEQKGRVANPNASLSITSDTMVTFDAFGGDGTLTYSLTGVDEGDKPAVTCDKNWISIKAIGNGTVEYIVAESTSSSSRRAMVTLTYGSLKATVMVTQEAQNNELTITANKSSIKLGESITFSVTLGDHDVTAKSTIYYYNTSTVVANPLTPTESGIYEIYAKYDSLSSKRLTVSVVPSNMQELPADPSPESYDFNQRILLVDHTGTSCPNCPAVKDAFKTASESANYKDKFNVVYSYSYNSTEACYSSAAKTLWNYYKEVCKSGDELTGYPSFTTNYCYNWTGKAGSVLDRIDTFWDKDVTASIAISNVRKDSKLTINAAIKSSKSQDFKLSLWLLEDGVYETQSGAGSSSWMHTHHNIMRDGITGISASDIAGVEFGYVEANTTVQRIMEFDLFIGSSWKINNCKLIAIISAPSEKYDGKYEVVNTAICEFNSTIGFDYKK